MENKEATLARLADLVDRLGELHERLNKLQLGVEAYLRRN